MSSDRLENIEVTVRDGFPELDVDGHVTKAPLTTYIESDTKSYTEPTLVEYLKSRYAPESVQHLYASIIIDELIRLGIDPFIISPGMRAVPLFMALEGSLSAPLSGKVKKMPGKILVNDERSAGFYAVGAAKAGAFPALICTSGTAVANYHPAVVEAWYSRTPLLVITTDRPWELLHAGANQTIHQKDMFRDCTVQSLDLPAPDTHISVHSLLSTLDYLIARARMELRPVHLNLGFRKPFYGDNFDPGASFHSEDFEVLSRWSTKGSSYIDIRSSRSIYSPKLPVQITREPNTAPEKKNKVVIIAGPAHSVHWNKRSGVEDFQNLVLQKAKDLKVPILTDIHSNMRQLDHSLVCAAHQLYLKELIESGNVPDVVLYVGDRIVSTACQEFLEAVGRNKNSRIIKFQTHAEREDAIENEFIHFTHVTPYLDEAIEMLPSSSDIDVSFTEEVLEREKRVRDRVTTALKSEHRSERSFVSTLLKALPSRTRVILSASTIFREADNFAYTIAPQVELYGNRGATGIDGIISTGIGLGRAGVQGAPVFVLLGDQAALHDLTALSLLKNSVQPVVIAVVNNQGGALFNIVKKDSILSTLLNRHDLTFKSFAEGFGVSYHRAGSVDEAKERMCRAFDSKTHLLLEIPVDGKESAMKLNTIGE